MKKTHNAFGLLFASVFGREASRLVVRATEVDTPQGMIWWGLEPDGTRHLLVPISDSYAFSERLGGSLELSGIVDVPHPLEGRYLDLHCADEALGDVFATLCDDALDRVEANPEEAPAILLNVLDEWRRLLSVPRAISEETARGLFGELCVLERLAKHNPLYAVETWTGPEGAAHDFATATGDLEVKTSTKETMEVTISSLHQLDPPPDGHLTLIRLQVTSSPTGLSISEMLDRLASMGCPKGQLVNKLASAGFLAGLDALDSRFQVFDESTRAWSVTPDFPGLRASDLPAHRRDAIGSVRYGVNLSSAPGAMSREQLDEVILKRMSNVASSKS